MSRDRSGERSSSNTLNVTGHSEAKTPASVTSVNHPSQYSIKGSRVSLTKDNSRRSLSRRSASGQGIQTYMKPTQQSENKNVKQHIDRLRDKYSKSPNMGRQPTRI